MALVQRRTFKIFIQLFKASIKWFLYNCLMKEVQGLSKAFGQVIAELRVNRGMSQEKLAEAIDSTNVYISLLENGLRKPSLNATILIAQSLGIEPSKLIEDVGSLLENRH